MIPAMAHSMQFDLNSITNDAQHHGQPTSQSHMIQSGQPSHVLYTNTPGSMIHDPSSMNPQYDCSSGTVYNQSNAQYVPVSRSSTIVVSTSSSYDLMQSQHEPRSNVEMESQDMHHLGDTSHALHEQLDLDCLINSDAAFYSHDPHVSTSQINTSAFLNEPYVSKRPQSQQLQSNRNPEPVITQEPYTLPTESDYSSQATYTISQSELLDHTLQFGTDHPLGVYSHSDTNGSESIHHHHLPSHLVSNSNHTAMQMADQYLSGFDETLSVHETGTAGRNNFVSSASDCFSTSNQPQSITVNNSNSIGLMSLAHSNPSFVQQQHSQVQQSQQQQETKVNMYDSSSLVATHTPQLMSTGMHAIGIPNELLHSSTANNGITLQFVGSSTNDQYVAIEPQPTVIIKNDSSESSMNQTAASNPSVNFMIANSNSWQSQASHSTSSLSQNEPIVYSMTPTTLGTKRTSTSELLPPVGQITVSNSYTGPTMTVTNGNGSCNVVKSISQVKILPPQSSVITSLSSPPQERPEVEVIASCSGRPPQRGITTRPCIQKINPVILSLTTAKQPIVPSSLADSKRLKVIKTEPVDNGTDKPPITVRISLKDNRAKVKDDRPLKRYKLVVESKEASKSPQCIRKGCKRIAVNRADWDNGFCSSDCVVSYCRESFQNWVKQRADQTISSPSSPVTTTAASVPVTAE